MHPSVHRVVDLVGAFGLTLAGQRLAEDARLTGVSLASGDVVDGDVFVAVPGLKVHGATYAAQAVDGGAVAILTDAAGLELLGDDADRVPVLLTDDPRSLAGPVAAWAHDQPGERLVSIGITGTNGKTTTTYFVDAALRAVHPVTALLGTVELRIGEDAVESPRTTVEAPALQALLAAALERHATAVAMEVSSHALALGRVNGLTFDVVGFTNLQRDHLDFHGDMEGYFRDKARLFAPGQATQGVVVVDDAWGRRLVSEARIPVQSVATHVGSGVDADWVVTAGGHRARRRGRRRSPCAAPTAPSTRPRAPCRVS